MKTWKKCIVLKKGISIFLIFLFSFFSIVFADAAQVKKALEREQANNIPGELKQLYAKSACLMDAASGRVLFEKNGSQQLPMASTTKIMTCIIALENANLDDIITFSSKAASQPDVQLNANTGEKYYLKDLLYALMLESYNDVAVAIAEHVGGSVEGFAKLMNEKAKELDCLQTCFITPNGLDSSIEDENGEQKVHSTTAADLARIMKYCIIDSPKKKEFLEITRTSSYSFEDIEKKRAFSCNNHNAFLSMMEGALSGKTGFTGNAGYCYVGALQRDGKTFIVSLLACGWPNNKSYKWSDTRKLMTYALENYRYYNVFDREKAFKPVLVENGVPESGDLKEAVYVDIGVDIEEENKNLILLLREDEKIKVKYEIPDMVLAPVKARKKVGIVNYYLEDELIKTYPVITLNEVRSIDFKWCLKQVAKRFVLLKK